MKNIITLIILLCSLNLISQNSEVNIKFKVSKEAEIWIGKAWDYTYTEMKTPINVDFDGNNLKMIYDSGKVYWKTNILSYEIKETKQAGELERETFILKIEDGGFIQYLIIEKSYSYGEIKSEIKLPWVAKTGQTMSYHYFQEI
jgi:hypothetical protein